MVAAFLITLREGLEAFLLVGILLAFLRKLGAQHHAKWIFVGVAAGLLGSLVAAFLFQVVVDQFHNDRYQHLLMIFILLFASSVLSYMALWMHKQARAHTENVKKKLESYVTKGNMLGMVSLAFVAVMREGIETVLFFSALFYSAASLSLSSALIGALGGLMASVVLVWLLLRGTRNLSIQPFFRYTSLLIIIIAAGLFASAVNMMQSIDLIHILKTPLFDISWLLDDQGTFGTFLRALFGYNASPTGLQFLCWGLYLGTAVVLWYRGYSVKDA